LFEDVGFMEVEDPVVFVWFFVGVFVDGLDTGFF
jgi:hypothetical protein